MMNNSEKIDKELVGLIYERTKDKVFAQKTCVFLDTDSQKNELIQFIKDNDPTKNEINHKAFELVMF